MFVMLLTLLACGPSKEELVKEVMASQEIQQMVKERAALAKEVESLKKTSESSDSQEDIENLKAMAKCLTKISQGHFQISKSSNRWDIRRCGKVGQSTDERKAYEEKLKAKAEKKRLKEEQKRQKAEQKRVEKEKQDTK